MSKGKSAADIRQSEHADIGGVAGKKVFNVDSKGNIIDFGGALGSNVTYSNISLTSAAVQIMGADTTRLSVIIKNISLATVFVGSTSIVDSSSGMELKQDDSIVFDKYDGAIFGRADATGHNVRFIAELD